MWLSAMANVQASDTNIFAACDKINICQSVNTSSPAPVAVEDIRSSAKILSRQDVCKDSTVFKSEGTDVTQTDSDSGAIDDAEDTQSDSVIVTSPSPAPDGGYGWVVVVASFFNAFIIDGIGSCFGLIFPHVVDQFGASALVTSFAGSLFLAFLVMGSISAALVRRFGYRLVAITGGVLACSAFVISTFSPNVVAFILSYGLFAGCSCGLVFLPSVVIVNGYFHERRGLANGIITSGSGAGLLVLAPLVNYLLRQYSLNGAVLIMAGVLLNMCVFSSLYRPPETESSGKGCLKGTLKKPSLVKLGDESTDSGNLSNSGSTETMSTVEKDLEVMTAVEVVPVCDSEGDECVLKEATLPGCKKKAVGSRGESKYDPDSEVSLSERGAPDGQSGKSQDMSYVCRFEDLKTSQLFDAVSVGPCNPSDASQHQQGDGCEVAAAATEGESKHMNKNLSSVAGGAMSQGGGGGGEEEEEDDPSCLLLYHEIDSHKAPVIRLPHAPVPRGFSRRQPGGHQFWRSAYHLPTAPALHTPGAMHSSAHDVTVWGSANSKVGLSGLVPLAARAALLVSRRGYNHHSSHDEDYNSKKRRSLEADHLYKHLYDYHHNYDHNHQHDHHQLHPHKDHLIHIQHDLTAHRAHHHHSSHASVMDKGSNLYLTGSISTLMTQQVRHILHLAASHDAGQFPAGELCLTSRSNLSQCSRSHNPELLDSRSNLPFSSKSNISHGSRPHIELLHFTEPKDSRSLIPISSTLNISLDSKSHLPHQSSTLLPVASSSCSKSSNADGHETLAAFSSKNSLATSPVAAYHQVTRKGSTSQWSMAEKSSGFPEETQVLGASGMGINTDLGVPTTGFSLLEMLRMPAFHLFCLGSCLIQIGYPLAGVFLADLAYHQGLTESHSAVLMGVLGGLNIAGRLLSGMLANLGVKPLRLLSLPLFVGGVACLFAPLYTGFWALALFAGLFGFFLGFFPPIQPLVIVEYFGLDSLASVFGLLSTVKGLSSMLGPPLAGWIYDVSGQYQMSFMFGGAVFIFSAVVHLLMPLFRPKRR